jgi:DNA-binding response OmpR family regulator
MTEVASGENKKKVFVVEDDPFLVKAYQMKLSQEGMEVWTATDGKEALKFVAEHEPPNIVLLDLMLPGASGFDILQVIRANETWKKVPVIVLSNLGQSQDVQKAQELGVQDYIVKANTRITEIVDHVRKTMN